ncbi:MAG: hypothetical protein R3F02_14295 [Thiolinea sp.]
MTTYWIQTALLILAAFIIGLILGKLLRKLFCRPAKYIDYGRTEADSTYRKPNYGLPEADPNRKPHLSGAVAGTGAAVGGLAAAALNAGKPEAEVEDVELDVDMPDSSFPGAKFSDFTMKEPELDIDTEMSSLDVELPSATLKAPDVDIDVPDVDLPAAGLNVPEVDVSVPDVDVDVPEVELSIPDVELPSADLDLPEVDVSVPDVDVEVPEVELSTPEVDLPSAELDMPDVELPSAELDVPEVNVDTPDVDLQTPEVELGTAPEGGIGLGKIAAGVAAAGAGLAAKAGFDKPDADADIEASVDASVDMPEADISVPEIDTSEFESEIDIPHVDIDSLKTELDAPDVDLEVSDVELQTPQIKLPTVEADTEMTAPEVTVETPEIDADMRMSLSGEGAVGSYSGSNVDDLGDPTMLLSGKDTEWPEVNVISPDDAGEADGQEATAESDEVRLSGDGVDWPEIQVLSDDGDEAIGSIGGSAAGVVTAASAGAVIAASGAGADSAGDVSAGRGRAVAESLVELIRAEMAVPASGSAVRIKVLELDGCACDELELDAENEITLVAGGKGKLSRMPCEVTQNELVMVNHKRSSIESGQVALFLDAGIVVCRQGDDYTFAKL